MIAFAQALPGLRAALERDLSRAGLPREKVLAAVVRLLETTLIRVGNDEYARQNRSYGLTTLRDRHAAIHGDHVEFRFRGKAGKTHTIGLRDRRLARIVKRCQDLPGEELFQYVDAGGNVCDVESGDVNEYLRAITRHDFTAKDFRTWAGTVLAAWALAELRADRSKTAARKNIVRAVEHVSQRLGNTPAICRKCYVHPAVFDSYLDGTLVAALRARAVREQRRPGLSSEERAVLALLSKRLAAEARRRPLAARRSSGRKALRAAGRCAPAGRPAVRA
jgi:DNA topoisomerase-1